MDHIHSARQIYVITFTLESDCDTLDVVTHIYRKYILDGNTCNAKYKCFLQSRVVHTHGCDDIANQVLFVVGPTQMVCGIFTEND